jgi:hypothetical protein
MSTTEACHGPDQPAPSGIQPTPHRLGDLSQFFGRKAVAVMVQLILSGRWARSCCRCARRSRRRARRKHQQGRGRASRFIPWDVRAGRQRFDGLSEQLRGELAVERRLGTAVHGSFESHRPEHHLGMVGIVFVDRNRPAGAVDRLKPAPGVSSEIKYE